MIRVFSWPLSLWVLNDIATATLAGVVVSLLGTLMAMLALWELARPHLGEEGAFGNASAGKHVEKLRKGRASSFALHCLLFAEFDPLVHHHRINPGQRNVGPDLDHHQHEQGEQDPLAKFGDLEGIGEGRNHGA